MQEKRNFTRINFETETEIIFQNTKLQCRLVDISLQGALLCFDKNPFFSVNEECEIRIKLNASEITMTFFARVVHIHKNSIGYKFISTDIESLTHLRTLLSVNLGNADKITKELFFLKNKKKSS